MKSTVINKYDVIGMMSGTSLDGVDIAYCHFEWNKKHWSFSIKAAQTFSYSSDWKNKLSSAQLLSGEKLMQLHSAYGSHLGELCHQFIRKNKLKKIDLIASHGHTIFHQPRNRFTFQLGDGNAIHSITHIPIACDFRSLDVTLGGEGAPLVPIGDRLLFNEYDACLNLGGIANISMDLKGKRKAFDVCFCNMGLNYLAGKVGKEYDKNGKMSAGGKVNNNLLREFERIYSLDQKKKPSLAREGFEKDFQVLLDNETIPLNDRLRTTCESIAREIELVVPKQRTRLKLLATGGGAHNEFLIHLLNQRLSKKAEIIVPDKMTVDFKEALVFAFLGVLCLRKEINVLKSVTGAGRDSCSGVLIG